MMREHGLSPMKNKKIGKCLTHAEILIKDAPTTSTSSTKQRISSVKLGRFASQRGQTYRDKYAKAKAVKTIHRMKAKRREQHVRSFLVRSDNTICLPCKIDCVKIGKEKKQVYVLKEYLCNLYKKYCAEIHRKKISFSRFCNKKPKEIKLVKYAQRMVCLCFKHTNVALNLKALDKALPRFDDVDPDHFVEKYEAKDVDALLYNITDSVSVRMETNPDGKWLQEDLFCDSGCICCRLQKQVIPGISELCQTQITRHKSVCPMVHEIKGNLNEETCTVLMDFADNFVSTHGEEIPSHYIKLQEERSG